MHKDLNSDKLIPIIFAREVCSEVRTVQLKCFPGLLDHRQGINIPRDISCSELKTLLLISIH